MTRFLVKLADNTAVSALALFVGCVVAGLLAMWRGAQIEVPGIITLSPGSENGLPALSFTPDWAGILLWSLVLGVLVTVVGVRSRATARAQSGAAR